MRKRTQLNIEIDEDLLKNLKFMALSQNIKLNALVKEILSEKIKSSIPSEIVKTLKYMALAKNIKLNALVKDILSEKVKSNTRGEINKKISDELDEIKKRISKLEKS